MPDLASLRILLIFTTALAACGLGGCIGTGLKGKRCLLLLLVDGHQVRPTYAQFQAIDKALGPQLLEQRGLVLIHDIYEAEMVATVEIVPRQSDPSQTDLILRDVTENTATRAEDVRYSPSIIESIREHNEAFRGFTRPGDEPVYTK